MSRFMFLLIFPLLFLAADGPSLPVPINPASVIAWDAVTLNADGTPCDDLAGYVLALSDATVDLAAGGVSLHEVLAGSPGLTQEVVAQLVAGRVNGVYRVWCRAYDPAGNLSAWSEPLLVALDTVPPGKVQGMRVKVTVIVEVGG